MGLTINRVNAELGIETSPSRLDIRSENAKLGLRHKETRVNIHTELPKIIIDQYDAFASAGLKGNFDLAREGAQFAYQQVMDYISKTAQNGDQLASIQYKGNVLAEIARRDSRTEHEFGLDYIPKVGPQFSVAGGEVSIEAEPNGAGANNGVEGEFVPGNVAIDYTPSKVNIYIKQYHSVNISYEGSNFDTFK